MCKSQFTQEAPYLPVGKDLALLCECTTRAFLFRGGEDESGEVTGATRVTQFESPKAKAMGHPAIRETKGASRCTLPARWFRGLSLGEGWGDIGSATAWEVAMKGGEVTSIREKLK